MEILIGFEHNYVMPYGVMLYTLVSNNPNEIIHVHAIIGDNVTDKDKDELQKTIGDKNHITFYLFRSDRLKKFPILTWTHFRESCYYRLFAASILPADVDKILYLDGDMVVMHNLNELWETDISNYAVAGVMNQTESVMVHNRLEYPSTKGYVNNGVLLMNLNYWRKYGLEIQCADFINKNKEKIIMADQDVMNYIVQDSKMMLPIRYNVQENFYYKVIHMTCDYWGRKDEIDNAVLDPYIIHFTGPVKPWMQECIHPRKEDFLRAKQKTIWRNQPLSVTKTPKKLKQRVKDFFKKYLLFKKVQEFSVVENKF